MAYHILWLSSKATRIKKKKENDSLHFLDKFIVVVNNLYIYSFMTVGIISPWGSFSNLLYFNKL